MTHARGVFGLGMLAVAVVVAGGLAAGTALGAGPDEGWKPGASLKDDLATLEVKLIDGYASARPRLLYSASDREVLEAKAKANPKLWAEVLASSKRLGDEAPGVDEIEPGTHYWRIERVQSGALDWFVTGNKAAAERAARWMVAYCKVPVWGTGFRDNLDLQASWYLYHISIAYDTLHDELSDADRKVVREGLAGHARAIYKSLDPNGPEKFRYDQNHTYIPTIGLATAALSLLGEEPEAADWLKRAYAVMRRCRYALGDDGYYYEGTGYWSYALHWHVRYADLIGRATGENYLSLPALKENWRFPLYLGLPGAPWLIDIGDTGRWGNGTRDEFKPTNYTMLWQVASANKIPEAQTVAGEYYKLNPDHDYPAAAFLWYDPSVKAMPLGEIPAYHYFPDEGFVSWRSSWGPEATVCMFRCGPPAGHAAAAKLKEMQDWIPNCGHVHPDIGAIWLYGKEAMLIGGTGYTARKFTRDHNTLLVDDVGQAMDGTYHNERGYPYDKFNEARIDRLLLGPKYGFVSGEFGSVYPEAKVGKVSVRRTLVMTDGWVLMVDDMKGEHKHALSWIIHSDAKYAADGKKATMRLGSGAGLAVLVLDSQASEPWNTEPAVVAAGTAPGEGKQTARGFQLVRKTEPAESVRLVTLLVPLAKDEPAPTAELLPESTAEKLAVRIATANGAVTVVRVDMTWKEGGEGPVTFGK